MKFVTPISHDDRNREKILQTQLRFTEPIEKFVDSVFIENTSANIEILDILPSESLFSVKYRLKSGANNESISYSIALNDTIMGLDSLPLTVDVSTKELSTCTCTKLDKQDVLEYLWIHKKDTVINSINEEKTVSDLISVIRQDGKIILRSNGTSSVNIRVYTIEGQLITEIKKLSTAEILQENGNGLYVIVIENTAIDSSDNTRFQLIKIYK